MNSFNPIISILLKRIKAKDGSSTIPEPAILKKIGKIRLGSNCRWALFTA